MLAPLLILLAIVVALGGFVAVRRRRAGGNTGTRPMPHGGAQPHPDNMG